MQARSEGARGTRGVPRSKRNSAGLHWRTERRRLGGAAGGDATEVGRHGNGVVTSHAVSIQKLWSWGYGTGCRDAGIFFLFFFFIRKWERIPLGKDVGKPTPFSITYVWLGVKVDCSVSGSQESCKFFFLFFYFFILYEKWMCVIHCKDLFGMINSY